MVVEIALVATLSAARPATYPPACGLTDHCDDVGSRQCYGEFRYVECIPSRSWSYSYCMPFGGICYTTNVGTIFCQWIDTISLRDLSGFGKCGAYNQADDHIWWIEWRIYIIFCVIIEWKTIINNKQIVALKEDGKTRAWVRRVPFAPGSYGGIINCKKRTTTLYRPQFLELYLQSALMQPWLIWDTLAFKARPVNIIRPSY